MTAPIWMASPPEVHSALLSGGPGPASLLAAAQAWNSLSAEYASVADELSAVLAGVQAGAWQGPSAESYVAANVPYLAWLMQASADSAAAAAQHETAAAAYTAALAAMPTLGELAANHATHALLMATNFLGINTIAIALNEADYVRMWIQAVATMTTYQTVAGAAAAAPQTSPAPQIQKATTATTSSGSSSADKGMFLHKFFVQVDTIKADLQELSSNPSAAITHLESDIPALIGQLPHYAGEVFIHFAPQLTQLADISYGLIAPALAGAGLGLAGSGAAGLAGLAGLSALPAGAETVPVAAGAPAVAPTPAAATPVSPTPAPATVASAPALAPAPAPAPAAPPAASAPPPAPPAGPGGFPYLVGGVRMSSAASGQTQARTRDSDAAPAPRGVVAAAAQEQAKAPRRPQPKVNQLGRGYEYLDLGSEPDVEGPAPRVAASDQGAGPLGFAGTAGKAGVGRAAGLTTLAGDKFGSGPTVPMMPGTWEPGGADNADED